MPIRNPFKRGPGGLESTEGIPRETTDNGSNGFQKTNVVGAKPIDIKEPLEYQLSEINDSGVFLPPSPPERKVFWNPSRTSTSSSTHRSVLNNENEPFNMSRESFDSYRRSFDISARSAISDYDVRPRQSLDSRRAFQSRPQRPSFQETSRIDRPEGTVDEGFEDVGLTDDKPKKRGLFARFGDEEKNVPPSPTQSDGRPTSSHHGWLNFPGRKRGQSGQGSELGAIPRPNSRNAVAVSAE